MNELLSAVYEIINHQDPAGELAQVDNYIELYLKNPRQFVLPRKHKHLRLLIAHYAKRPQAFFNLARSIRNTVLERDGESIRYEQLQKFKRRLEVRLSQQARRARVTRLNGWMQEHHKDLTAPQRQAWIAQVEAHWTARRSALLREARREHGGTLPTDVAGELREAFWEQVEADITAGRIPPYQEDPHGLEPFEPHGI